VQVGALLVQVDRFVLLFNELQHSLDRRRINVAR
jgi:hypothetical protein